VFSIDFSGALYFFCTKQRCAGQRKKSVEQGERGEEVAFEIVGNRKLLTIMLGIG
jgi:hypothetical protein